MLELKNVNKVYVNKKDPSKNVVGLKNVSIKFPQRGFVFILGPSGCGKTTLLNILGGLDTKYSGDFVVDGVDTKVFKSKDWDAYRNNHVGFVFQEYNLIPHQNVSKNVELVLTIAGASKLEVKEKAKKVLESVDLKNKLTQKPNSLSGGQKQRVAIARALVNDPELILADEPTSALDTKTSEQVMEILKDISKKKLVIMVTHNVDLAKKYASRIISILDGEVTKDEKLESFEQDEELSKRLPQTYKYGSSKMKLSTAIELSSKSLLGKLRRTILTILAGCIGIICLTVILGIMGGAKDFGNNIVNEFSAKRPLQITSFRPFSASQYKEQVREEKQNEKAFESAVEQEEEKANNSTKLQTEDNVKENIVKKGGISTKAKEVAKNNLTKEYQNHVSGLMDKMPQTIKAIDIKRAQNPFFLCKVGDNQYEAMMGQFNELPLSNTLDEQYEFFGGKGRWPSKKEEVVLVSNKLNIIDPNLIKAAGLEGKKDLDAADFVGKKIGSFVTNNGIYKKAGNLFAAASPEDYGKIANGPEAVPLTIVGVVREKKEAKPKDDLTKKLTRFVDRKSVLSNGIVYTKALGDYIYETTKNSEVVKAQLKSEDSVLVGGDTATQGLDMSDIYDLVGGGKKKKKPLDLLLKQVGFSENATSIDVYIKDPVVNRKKIVEYLNSYNEGKEDKDKIYLEDKTATQDIAYTLRTISMFLFFTVGLASLLTSLIMIALLEFVSVLERTREIGVLRSIGARKKDISRLFKTDALIIGFFTGVFGVFVGSLCSFPINALVRKVTEISNISLVKVGPLIWVGLIIFSLFVTLLAGLIPAKIASRKDPVKILTGTSN